MSGGHGASTILMAQAFPNATFIGFDCHEPSIARAAKAGSEAGVAERCHFEVAAASDYPGENYDLVTFFDCRTTWETRLAPLGTYESRWRRTGRG